MDMMQDGDQIRRSQLAWSAVKLVPMTNGEGVVLSESKA